MRAGAVPGSRSRPSVSAARTRDGDVLAAQGLQQQGHHPLGGHAGEGAHGALLDELALVAQQLEEQHGRVLVAQPADGGRRLRPHLRRGIVDEGRHQVDARGRRDPGQAAHGALAHRVVGMGQAVRGRPPRSRKPMETRAWVAYSCRPAPPAASMSGRSARGSLQPAQGDGRGAPVLGVVVAQSMASRWSTRSSRRSAACTSGSRLSPPAVARCSMATTAWMADVAQRGVRVVAGGARGGAAPRARPGGPGPPWPGRAAARRPAAPGARGRPAGRRSRPGRGSRGTAARARPRSAADERQHRLGVADLAQAGRGGVADVHVGVAQGRDQGRHRAAVAQRARASPPRSCGPPRRASPQQREQRRHRGRAPACT